LTFRQLTQDCIKRYAPNLVADTEIFRRWIAMIKFQQRLVCLTTLDASSTETFNGATTMVGVARLHVRGHVGTDRRGWIRTSDLPGKGRLL
jgi:hypothetical protein